MNLVDEDRLRHKGYIVYMDNFYSSPALFKELVSIEFAACGTARKNHRGIPPTVTFANLHKGEVCSTREEGILSLKWKDKCDVLMLSTFHDNTMVDMVETVQKPRVVEDYNQFMGGVDKSK